MFQLFNKIPQFFFAPDTPTSTSGAGNTASIGKGGSTGVPAVNAPTSKEDVIEFLGADDEHTDVIDISGKPPKGTRDKSKEKTNTTEELAEETSDGDETPDEDELADVPDELEELEAELQGPTEEQLELVTPVRRKEILAKYPSLFKDFPYLEKAYYREQQFTELLPTIDDAKMAVEKSQTLDNFEADLMGGNTEKILKAVREENINSFNKIVDDYLPTLAKVDEKAYFHVLGNVTKHTITAMVQEARKSGNEALQSAALLLNQFVFGSSEFHPPSNLAKEGQVDKGKEKVDERQQAWVRQQFESTNNDLNTKVNNTLKNTIDANIDPKKSMSDYVRKNASKDALETLETLISKDARFKVLTDKLWKAAFEANFSKQSTDRIRTAFLSKAKTLLPSVIQKARNEALRGTGHRVKADDDTEQTSNKGPVAPGKPRSQQPSGKIKEAKDIPKGMRSIDFLMQD